MPVLILVALQILAPTPLDLALYIPFDGNPTPVLGYMPVGEVVSDCAHVPGLLGEAADLRADCRLRLGSPFPHEAGTLAFWLKPHWPAQDSATHYLICLYGDPGLPEPWLRNRFSIAAAEGRLSFMVFGHEAGERRTLQADATMLADGRWHHVAATWEGINGGERAASLCLYLDGQLVSRQAGIEIAMEPSSPLLDIGRDSDASPDYAEALLDDLFLYSRALSAEEIASAFDQVRRGTVEAREPAQRLRDVPDWPFPHLPYRVEMAAPVHGPPRVSATAYARPALTEQLRSLGVPARPDPATMRLLDMDGGSEVPLRWTPPFLEWDLGAEGGSQWFVLYFASPRYEYLGPLLVAGPPLVASSVAQRAVSEQDYARSAYGDAWDFDEGDTEEIDAFGDKPEYIRDVSVADGVLSAHVLEDPYIIWGAMWGPEDTGYRLVRLDLSRYNLLVMRLRQSVDWAAWRIMGRVLGSDRLLDYQFAVTGTDWQTVHIDLARDARWSGTLSAFRVDLTEKVEADVALDYVTLVPAVEANVGAVETLGDPDGEATRVVLDVAELRPVAGSEQLAVVRVTDRNGAPVRGQPVVVRLVAGSEGRLEPRDQPALPLPDGGLRGLTGPDGVLGVRLVAGRRARESSAAVTAKSEFPAIEAEPVVISTVPGPPDHYVVLSRGVTIVREEETPLELPTYIADACGNQLPIAGRKLTWSVEGGEIRQASQATDATGAASALLVPDTAERWVYRVRVSDDQGLEGVSGEICVTPKGPRTEPIQLGANGYFVAGGAPFIPLGGFYAVWIPQPAPAGEEEGRLIRAFTEATEEDMHHWFAFLESQGVTALRLMLRTHGPDGTEAMDVGGRVNRRLFAKVLRLLDIARRYGMRFLLTLHDDYDKPIYCNERHLSNFALPALEGTDPSSLQPFQRRFLIERRLLGPHERYTDPDAIACQDQYTREIVGYLRDNPTLFAWELENEMVDCPAEWVNHQVAVIREVDAVTPICVSHGGGGLATADPLWWTERTATEFYSYHLYPLWTTTPELDYGAAVDLLARYGRMAGTCFLGEAAGDEFSDYPADRDADRRYIMRDIIWFSLVNSNPGCFFWNARGTEVAEFRLAREVVGQVDWTTWQRKRPETAVLVPHPLDSDRYYATARGQADWAMMGRYCQHFLSAGEDFDFAMSPEGYAVTCDLSVFDPPGMGGGLFRPSKGFQLAPLTREDERQGLVYIRNFAGVRPWEVTPGRTMFLRDRAAAPMRVGLSLPWARVRARVWDLDTGAVSDAELAGDGTLDLGTTEHDFAVLWWVE